MKNQIIIILLLSLTFLFVSIAGSVHGETNADTLTINGIEIANITKNPIASDSDGNLLIVDEAGYQILYMPKFNHEFLLSIQDAPFEKYRLKAEKKLIKILNISKDEACWLYAVETTSVWINPDEAGKNYSLSFCKGKIGTAPTKKPTSTEKETTCPHTPDINRDGVTNSIDYAIAIQQYNQEGDRFNPSLPRFAIVETNAREDVNCDGIVDSLDLSIIIDSLGTEKQSDVKHDLIL